MALCRKLPLHWAVAYKMALHIYEQSKMIEANRLVGGKVILKHNIVSYDLVQTASRIIVLQYNFITAVICLNIFDLCVFDIVYIIYYYIYSFPYISLRSMIFFGLTRCCLLVSRPTPLPPKTGSGMFIEVDTLKVQKFMSYVAWQLRIWCFRWPFSDDVFFLFFNPKVRSSWHWRKVDPILFEKKRFQCMATVWKDWFGTSRV